MNKNGSALMVTMSILMITSVVLGSAMSMSSQRLFMAKKLTDKMRSQIYAESGADQAYSILSTNFSLRTNSLSFPLTQFGLGSYDVDLELVSDDIVIVRSTGVCNDSMSDVIVDVKNYGTAQPWGGDVPNPFEYAIVSGGNFSWGGGGSATDLTGENAKIHSNNDFYMNGNGQANVNVTSSSDIGGVGSVGINGTTDAPSYSGAYPGNVNGSVSNNTPPYVPNPDINLTPYYNEAMENGQVYQGPYEGGGTNFMPDGGILWVNGDFTWTGNEDFTGMVIATGNIKWTGGGNQIKYGDYPALISRDGDIDIQGNGEFHGLIYTDIGDITKQGDGAVTGTIMSGGNFIKGGGWDMMIYEDSTPLTPDGGSLWSDIVGISAWQK